MAITLAWAARGVVAEARMSSGNGDRNADVLLLVRLRPHTSITVEPDTRATHMTRAGHTTMVVVGRDWSTTVSCSRSPGQCGASDEHERGTSGAGSIPATSTDFPHTSADQAVCFGRPTYQQDRVGHSQRFSDLSITRAHVDIVPEQPFQNSLLQACCKHRHAADRVKRVSPLW
jgi:hypothetical protein